MFVCSQIDEVSNSCLSWVDISTIFSVPQGAGLKIGLALFALAAVAWGLKTLAKLLLNQR